MLLQIGGKLTFDVNYTGQPWYVVKDAKTLKSVFDKGMLRDFRAKASSKSSRKMKYGYKLWQAITRLKDQGDIKSLNPQTQNPALPYSSQNLYTTVSGTATVGKSTDEILAILNSVPTWVEVITDKNDILLLPKLVKEFILSTHFDESDTPSTANIYQKVISLSSSEKADIVQYFGRSSKKYLSSC